MDVRQCRYIVKIAECGSITRAAEALFISQSGLNQQLARIERELGATLVDRTTHSLKITEAGVAVLDYAKEAIKREAQMTALVSDIVDGSVGEIRLNLAMEQGVQMFGAVFPRFHRAFPKVALKLTDLIVYDQYDRLMNDGLDIGMVFIARREFPELQFVHMADERFLLGIPKGHPMSRGYALGPDGDYPEKGLEGCENEPFTLMFSGSTMRQVIDPCFERAGYRPNILFETRTNHVGAMMAMSGLCLTVLPESQARLYPDTRWYRLPGNIQWECCLVYHRDNPPRRAGRYFIELAQGYFREEALGNSD